MGMRRNELGDQPGVTRREWLRCAAFAAAAPQLVRLPRFDTEIADEVVIVQFAADGTRLGPARVGKVVKTDAEWRAQLSRVAYSVTRRGDTEIPFTGAYWNLHEKGLFRCICCDTALFSSDKKFDSGTGWPSFSDAIADENVVTHRTRAPGRVESELTCRRCDAHLGDVFDDGPQPTGLRYCIDSVSLRFVKVK